MDRAAWIEEAKIWGDLDYTYTGDCAESMAIEFYLAKGFYTLGTSYGNTRILKNNNTGQTAYMTVKLINNPE